MSKAVKTLVIICSVLAAVGGTIAVLLHFKKESAFDDDFDELLYDDEDDEYDDKDRDNPHEAG
jgi:hypothetical protein